MIGAAWAWVRATGRWLLANPVSLGVVGAALALGSLAGVPVKDKLYDYMWRDPRFCDDCHVHDYANQAWAKSVHGQLTTCHDCHRVPIRHYPKNLVVTLFATPQVPEDIPKPHVTEAICEQCHSDHGGDEPLTGPMPAELRAQVVHVDQSPLHKLHLESKRRTPSSYEGGGAGPTEGHIECLDCHGGENLMVHRFPAVSEMCEACHEGIRPKDEHGGELSCLDCHARGFVGSNQSSQEARR